MNAKQTTFVTMASLPTGQQFDTVHMTLYLNEISKSNHFPDTYLRYMREYRQETGRQIVCINKRKSLYKIL
jgi:hypothetical protein